MKKTGVIQFLTDHAGRSPVSFHMPGHKGSGIYHTFGYEALLKDAADLDITEIPGADNLFQTESIIRETMEKYRKLYDVRNSRLLINGTSGGLIASVLASVPAGGKLVMARNCHKSVFNAVRLGAIEPVYAYPSVMEEGQGYGLGTSLSGPVEPDEIERCLAQWPEAFAVILPSPNYYGICSDIRAISEVVHRYGKILIVDQAHGAHLKFMKDQPAAAEECGADLVVNSTHKTLASFTQSAVLNVCSDGVDPDVLDDRLQMIQSTSPSYLLMASLDVNAELLTEHGEELFVSWQENLDWFYDASAGIPGLKVMRPEKTVTPEAGRAADLMDFTKINLDMSACGLDGNTLEEKLMERDIFPELVTGNILMCMTGIGNRRGDFEKLLTALQEIAEEAASSDVPKGEQGSDGAFRKTRDCHPEDDSGIWTKRRPLYGVPARRRMAHIDDCAGRICASSVIPYPPGIPLICPGEVMDKEDAEYIKMLRSRGDKVIGINENNEILMEG